MNNKLILSPTTDAAVSEKFGVSDRFLVTVILHATAGLTDGEYADIQVSHDLGTSWQDLWEGDAQIRLHSKNTAIVLQGPGTYRVDKDASTNAAGVTTSSMGG